jgi:hypothetical protein
LKAPAPHQVAYQHPRVRMSIMDGTRQQAACRYMKKVNFFDSFALLLRRDEMPFSASRS